MGWITNLAIYFNFNSIEFFNLFRLARPRKWKMTDEHTKLRKIDSFKIFSYNFLPSAQGG